MNKRGQTTVFIIIGIVVVIIVALYIVLTQTKIIPPLLGGGDASDQMSDIDEHISECMQEVGGEYLTRIGQQGGYLGVVPDSYRTYNDSSVSYLCYNQPGQITCSNRLLTVAHMENELEEVISQALESCINVYDYSDDVRAAEDWTLQVEIFNSAVDMTLVYPVEVIKSDEDKQKKEEFTYTFDDVPLGELYDVSMDIVNSEASLGDFDQLLYMLQKFSKYNIYKYRPYPDKIYQVKLREGGYVFQFAIEGEDTT
ncbi:MAG: hypothetical protein ABIJ18_00410 [archaeon]